jgi:hypothetical protein
MKMKKTITLNLIATNKYTIFLDQIIESAVKFFMTDSLLKFIIYTDSLDIEEKENLKVVHIEHEIWPGPTLKRFHYFCKGESLIEESDFSFYVDVDSTFTKEITSDIFGGIRTDCIIGTLHPGFYNSIGTPERNHESTACIPYGSDNLYYCGGFFGADSASFIEMSKKISGNIDLDLDKNIIAIWHDESHLNKYFFETPPDIILGIGFTCPEEQIHDRIILYGQPSIVFINKGSDEKRNELRNT